MTPVPDPIATLLHDYGWAGVFLWLAIRDVWPFLRDRLFPAAIEERKARLERVAKLEERQVIASEVIANAVVEMKLAMVSTNERLNELRSAQAEHHKATNDAITLMRERTRPREEVNAEREKSRPKRST